MKKLIIISTIIVLCMVISGCTKVNMTTEYAQRMYEAEILCNELNNRCIDGDTEACQGCCAESSRFLTLLRMAYEGDDPLNNEGGDE